MVLPRHTDTAAQVFVYADRELVYQGSLSADQTVPIIASDGVCNQIRIEEGTVYMEEADCPGQDCVKQGKISRGGQSIVCLPNKVTVEIRAGGQQELDDIVR